MNINILSATAIFTLVLNILLTMYLLKDKIDTNSYSTNDDEIKNFVLTPNAQNEIVADAGVLETEIILLDDSYYG